MFLPRVDHLETKATAGPHNNTQKHKVRQAAIGRGTAAILSSLVEIKMNNNA
jgi:hypothetical protein